MAYEIIATPAMLLSSADKIETNAETIRREIERIREMLEPVRSSFTGEKSRKFFQRYDAAYNDMQQWDNIVRSFAEEMREAAMRIRAVDEG